ncbi:excinuclease ABC subunit UvrA [Chitinophaga oryzae]|uniref:UvrABC system protein A n=1 Tax=Chitinophaga oryzae TaxID=2725414 RepID=A0AAE6ZDV2_9BACT|nr:excinuclease ABC subunit UvrA [Chitinophaga oryzae]QJB31116.1 excinuclease ABC subunit UvrA [Chitinophaga oryzae]QJB37601.1 excinuclease ABC subunit UvrA [Chitinophaga oryzae]
MIPEFIEIRGARENNLKNVDLRLPKRKITIFTGVSGSGKSSIVFDTIATEAQRQLYENFSMFIRSLLPKFPQPDADSIDRLSMAIVVDQKRLGGGSHSTMGTITDISPVLRVLFSRIGKPYVGYANAFSFNDPQGMCPQCGGRGRKLGFDASKFIDRSKSLKEGAIQAPGLATWEKDMYAHSGFFDVDKKLADYSEEEMELLLYSQPRKFKLRLGEGNMNATYMGVIEKFERAYIRRDIKTLSDRTQKMIRPYLQEGPCPSCKGARLNEAALSCRIKGYNIAELSAMEAGELITFLKEIDDAVAAPMVRTLTERLQHLVDMGLEYLTLNRETDTLSGGESQRVKMVKHLSSSLTDVLYIFDEPSVGLHPRDVYRLNGLLQKLRDKGNTVIVVEHDPDVIRIADHIVDVGPHAGTQGGRIMYEGELEGLLHSDTLTGKYLKHSLPLKTACRSPRGQFPITNANANNLHNVSVNIPEGVLTVVTGVAGSGKSSLIHHAFLSTYPQAVVIDQSPVGTSTRSNPATYTGTMDLIRKAFATANKVDASLFSFNSKGACENCQGSGVIYTDLAFLEGVKTPCEVCEGKRYKEEVLAYHFNGKSISDVLAMTVSEARSFFTAKDICRKLDSMIEVGLEYLTLGQPLSTLSGGECQRIKLASELHKKGSIYVMDEPTTGLHLSDVGRLVQLIDGLVEKGNTVVVIEHNLEVIKQADWIIDMGPEGGHKGGKVLFEGTPEALTARPDSYTGVHLRGSVLS